MEKNSARIAGVTTPKRSETIIAAKTAGIISAAAIPIDRAVSDLRGAWFPADSFLFSGQSKPAADSDRPGGKNETLLMKENGRVG